uniref:ATP-dependent RNA helicase n=1 Tax=Cacopsylla melanoneura TaxID=428564 RepID=A0A8D8UE79_9HEMI
MVFPTVDKSKSNGPQNKIKANPKSKFGKKKKGNSKFNVFKKKVKPKNIESNCIKALQERYDQIDPAKIRRFIDFPLSSHTLKGLKESGYMVPTEIQKNTIGLGLQGHDILGAAKTGSGKTLAFIVPLLEQLYCSQWTKLDGLGALVITPTRELAYQIFEALRNVGRFHEISAGLIIGGKDLHFEKNRLDHCNVIICTPGRLLQHMDTNPLFNCDNVKVLILDEADRCLDMGFEKDMNAILENLPPRQTLLFSATQTKSVRDLARLSLKDPKYISVDEHEKHATPESLKQSYIICNLEDKVNILWSFIRNHLKHKVLVFMSSCKQVKYMYEAFCRLRPNISLLALYGTLHQMRRMKIYEEFKRKSNVVLFATDIAARGLDFPAVNWVVQLDCPETATEYIHRAGRTARYHKGGECLLFLLPSETNMLQHLEEKKIPIDEIQVNMSKMQSIQRKLEALLARDTELKATAQRCFVSYAKSVFLMKDKSVFQIDKLDFSIYARSLGLAIPPRIRFLQKHQKQKQLLNNNNNKQESNRKHNDSNAESDSDSDNEDSNDETSDGEDSEEESEADTSVNKGPEEKTFSYSDRFRSVYNFHGGSDNEDDDEGGGEGNDGLFTLKRADHTLDDNDLEIEDTSEKKGKKPLTKAAVAKKIMRKKIGAGKKTVFDTDGEAIANPHKERTGALAKEYDAECDQGGIDLEKAKAMLREEDKLVDKKLFQAKVKAKHKEERIKAKLENSRKKKEKSEDEESGDDSGSESEGPDLSWLPDPDKIYGQRGSEDETDDDPDKIYGQDFKTIFFCTSTVSCVWERTGKKGTVYYQV